MKLTLFLGMMMGLLLSATAQSTYRVVYNLTGKSTGARQLICQKMHALYERVNATVLQPAPASTIQTNEVITNAMAKVNEGEPQPFNNRFVFKRDLAKKTLVYAESHTPYHYTVEDNELPSWTLMDEFKVIGGYNCQKARSLFRGREFVAWFAKEIPISAGPWKLAGLPGLILDAESMDGRYQFHFGSCALIQPTRDMFVVDFQGPTLLYSQYVQKADQYYQRKVDKIHGEVAAGFVQNLGADAKASPVTMNVENIEKTLEKKYVSAIVQK